MTASPSKTEFVTPTATRVRSVRRETHDTFTIELDAPAGGFRFQPGQFNMLYAFGVGEAAISLSGDPEKNESIVHTIRAVGSVTNALNRLKAGDALGVRGPYGTGWPLAAARDKDLVVVSGGLGLAPLRPVLYHVLANRGDFGRVALLHGVRSPEDHLFADELDRWSRSPELNVHLAATKGDRSWRWRIGVVTALFDSVEIDSSRTIALVCGPDVMIRFAERELAKRGVGDDSQFVSLERNMQCAAGFCGHCQFGPSFVCMDGPVFRLDRIRPFLDVREV